MSILRFRKNYLSYSNKVHIICGAEPIFWPMFAVSTGAAIIASQAMISATFSMIRNAMALGCFPRVTVRHTSKRIHGQIYIPEINWLVMCLSIAIVAIFRSTTQIGNAYGKSKAEGVFCCMSRTTAWKHSELNFLTR